MATLEDVKDIDVITKDLVNGYMKGIKQTDSINDTLHENIPALIYCWDTSYDYSDDCIVCYEPTDCDYMIRSYNDV